ncbi:MAG: hydrogenase maturation nickel metallochaperone HypA [Acidobacteria bacterium]|nr:hydrogenase maturation nickel metallochaperone HypA [Acidobacteriota bacterium]
MHELGIAENILDIVRRNVPGDRVSAVGNIRLRVGPFAGVVPDSLKFCFDVLSADAGMANAALQIEQTRLAASCRDCGNESEVKNFVFLCSACGGGNLEIISGKELEVVEIEMV